VPEELGDTLVGIELTQEAKKPMKEVEFVTDEQKAGILLEPVRRLIAGVLKKGIDDEVTTEEFNKGTNERIIRKRTLKRYAMSVVEIVKASEGDKKGEIFTKNQVYHHLPTLIEAGFVIKYGTVTTGKRTTDYYRRTAKGFVIATKPLGMSEKEMRNEATEKVERIITVFHLNVPNEKKEELMNLVMKCAMLDMSWEVKIGKLVTEDIADPEILLMYDWLLNIYGMGSAEYVELTQKIRNILFPND